jgi:hypothetical protein
MKNTRMLCLMVLSAGLIGLGSSPGLAQQLQLPPAAATPLAPPVIVNPPVVPVPPPNISRPQLGAPICQQRCSIPCQNCAPICTCQ